MFAWKEYRRCSPCISDPMAMSLIQMRIFIERGLAVIIGIVIPDKVEITEEIDKSQGIDLPV